MTIYVLRRLLQAIGVLLGVSLGVFLLLHISGDPVALLLPPGATQADVDAIRRELGLDDPLYVQYVRFLGGALHGDFGKSFRHNTPALPLVLERLPATFELTFAAMGIALLTSIPLGVISAVKRNSVVDRLSMALSLVGVSMPTFWLGLMFIIIFSVNLHLLPSFGRESWRSLILPAVTLGAYSVGRLARMTRSNMLEVLQRDYVRTARAKGLLERVVIARHALKNAAIPIITLAGLETGVLLGGAVITETVFAWPGVGTLVLQAISNRDYPLVQATVFVVATTFVLINLLVDLTYAYLDPRIRLD